MFSLSKTKFPKVFWFVLFALPTLGFFATSFMVEKDKELKLGKKAPLIDMKMDGVSGKQFSLQDEMGEKGLMVVFSCNTCPFVVGNSSFDGWEKQYNDLYDKAQAQNVGFVLINSNEAKRPGDDSKEEMIKHSKDKGYKMHYLIDKSSKLADAFGAKTTPHLFAFDAKGKLIFKGSIDNSWDNNRSELRTYAVDVIDFLGTNKKLKDATSTPRGCSIKRK